MSRRAMKTPTFYADPERAADRAELEKRRFPEWSFPLERDEATTWFVVAVYDEDGRYQGTL